MQRRRSSTRHQNNVQQGLQSNGRLFNTVEHKKLNIQRALEFLDSSNTTMEEKKGALLWLSTHTPFKHALDWFEKNGVIGNELFSTKEEVSTFVTSVDKLWNRQSEELGLNLVSCRLKAQLEKLRDENSSRASITPSPSRY